MSEDDDDDGDGIPDGEEDDDGDGIENDEDNDDDGDGIEDKYDKSVELWKVKTVFLKLLLFIDRVCLHKLLLFKIEYLKSGVGQ